MRTIAYSEIEVFAIENLLARMEGGQLDAAPIWSDLKSFPWAEFSGKVDILSGGYPCQPFSSAGKRLGKKDPRHLWPWIADGIRAMRPRICFFENVEGHISLGLREVIGELEEIGYQTAWGIFSAREVGAPHQRKRVFIVAHDAHGEQRAWSLLRQNWQGATLLERCGSGRAEELADSQCAGLEGFHHGNSSAVTAQDVGADAWASGERGAWEGCGELANASDGSNPAHGYAEAHRLPSEHWQEVCSGVAGGANATAWPSRPGEPQHGWEPPRVVLANAANHGHAASASGGGICGDEQDARRQEESQGVEQLEGADRPINVPSIQGRTSGSELGNDHREHAGHGEQRPERTLRDLSGGRGEAMGNAMQSRPSSEWSSRGQQDGLGESSGTMGNTNSPRPQERQGQRGAGIQRIDSHGGEDAERQAQPALGRDADGTAGGLGYAELSVSHHAAGRCESGVPAINNRELANGINNGCYNADQRPNSNGEQGALGETTETEARRDRIHSSKHGETIGNGSLYISCDNRTDELRLLGNGVVPATAERAFRTLLTELLTNKTSI